MNNINFAFFGTPSVASRTLDILHTNGYTPKIIITSPPARSGRGMHMSESPVSLWAKAHSIPCLTPLRIDSEFINKLSTYEVELSIVVAYGKILPQALIDLPKYKTVNIHYSLLPLYRGASPVEEALLRGDAKTGVSIQMMEFKLDSGGILARQEVSIGIDEMKEELRARLIDMGSEMLIRIIPDIIAGTIGRETQDESKATYCTKIKKEDGEINPEGDGFLNYNKYRAYEGWPGLFFFKSGKRIKITKARYENNSFIIERVVPEGKKEIDYEILQRNGN